MADVLFAFFGRLMGDHVAEQGCLPAEGAFADETAERFLVVGQMRFAMGLEEFGPGDHVATGLASTLHFKVGYKMCLS